MFLACFSYTYIDAVCITSNCMYIVIANKYVIYLWQDVIQQKHRDADGPWNTASIVRNCSAMCNITSPTTSTWERVTNQSRPYGAPTKWRRGHGNTMCDELQVVGWVNFYACLQRVNAPYRQRWKEIELIFRHLCA